MQVKCIRLIIKIHNLQIKGGIIIVKKILTVILCLVLSLSFPFTVFASTLPKTNNNSIVKPMISTWHYQNTTPLVGLDWHYTTYRYTHNHNLQMSQTALKAGINGLMAVVAFYLPVTALTRFVSTAIITAIQNDPALDTPTLYLEEVSWGLDESPELN